MKTRFFTFLLMAAVAVPFISCEKDNDNDPDTLIGTWALQESTITITTGDNDPEIITRDYTTEENESTITLTSDGAFTTRDWDEEELDYHETTGSFELRDGKLYVSTPGEEFLFETGLNYSISGNLLTITGTETVVINEELDIEGTMAVEMTALRR